MASSRPHLGSALIEGDRKLSVVSIVCERRSINSGGEVKDFC